MAMLKLPNDIQSLFCASTQICSYKRAVEELVYNSLDAESTSIAIRINVEQNAIQVIDNGCGVSKYNFSLIGQRHATSKFVDMSTLKSVPNKYGYRGQSLASIIEVSQNVKITSRCHDSEETWIKSFSKGKEDLDLGVQRPSKGTTVDIKGFLHNLKIKKKAIDHLKELNEIKAFLEQLSLVHNNISISLRDDAKNEIIFQLHKNRDIYQTLRSMFDIERKDLQELKVEKNCYKVTAFIGKKDTEVNKKHWIYLNGKYLQRNKLHKIVDDNLIKSLKLNQRKTRAVKSKGPFNQDDELKQKEIPCYFIFFTCPYYDYDINQTSKQTVVEFKDWDPINKLAEKMAKLYAGDMSNLKQTKNQVVNQHRTDDTRDQVKKIVDKILGSNSKTIRVSQMQNGIKGKITKRKGKQRNTKILDSMTRQLEKKKQSKRDKITYQQEVTPLSETNKIEELPTEIKSHEDIVNKERTKVSVHNEKIKNNKGNINIDAKQKNNNDKNNQNVRNEISVSKNQHGTNIKKSKPLRKHKEVYKKSNFNKIVTKANLKTTTGNTRKVNESKKTSKLITKKKEKLNCKTKNCSKLIRKKKEKLNCKTKNLIKFFEHDPTGSVKRRCDILGNKVNELMSYKKQRKRKIYINEKVQYSNIVKDNKNYSIRKKIGEIIIHDYIPKSCTYSPSIVDYRFWNKTKSIPYKSSYDLIKTILRTQETKNSCKEIVDEVVDDTHKSPENMCSYINTSAHTQNNALKPTSTDHEVVDDTHKSPENMCSYINTSAHTQNDALKPTSTDPIRDSPIVSLPRPTFRSHNYTEIFDKASHHYSALSFNCNQPKDKAKLARFITNQSTENFVVQAFKKRSTGKRNNSEFQNNKLHKFRNQFNGHQESFTIEFSKSNDRNGLSNTAEIIQNKNRASYFNEIIQDNVTHTVESSYEIINEINSGIGSTYTIHNVYNRNGYGEEESRDYIENSTEQIERGQFSQKNTNTENISFNNYEDNDNYFRNKLSPSNASINKFHPINKQHDLKMNVVFISKSQEKTKDIIVQTSVDKEINPLTICETVLSENTNYEQRDTNPIEFNDSLFDNDFEIDSILYDKNAYNYGESDEFYDNTSLKVATQNEVTIDNTGHSIKEVEDNTNVHESNRKLTSQDQHPINNISEKDQPTKDNVCVKKDSNYFNFKNRLRFVPKGMSQIFEKCQSRNACDYNLEEDYYEEAIYKDFAHKVQLNCEIFEPGVQNVNELTTKAIEKVKYKLNKDNASLVFNADSLKQAKVLKQLDNKFIAAKITERSHHSIEMIEYLVLFDQHAVHERIRLETNLKEYFDGNVWKSIQLDDIKLKVTKEEIVFLHNYTNKFMQLGLQWIVLNNDEVVISAIPLAILGKNPRQVDIVIKAVKNLIAEEINAIKLQSGCISLYPKAIMDLVFSEACRYAIKFGDRLTKEECVDLLNSLSECKTPFQCAHGRPVMAVLVDIKSDTKKYTVNISSIQKWQKVKK